MRLRCFDCGKSVSSEVPDETVLRAAASCPECLEKERAPEDQGPALRQFSRFADFLDRLAEIVDAGHAWDVDTVGALDAILSAVEDARSEARSTEGEFSEILRRNRAMAACAARVRKKADLATGISEAPDEDRDLNGRSAGMEGAVDLLISKYSGALSLIRDREGGA